MAATVAIVLVFVSGVVSPVTSDLATHTQSYLANAVGVTAGVAPNELNVITARLTERERELAAREAALEQREIAVNLNTGAVANSPDYSTYVMSSILFILLVLIMVNYTLDFARMRQGVAVSYVRTKSRST